MTSLHKNILNPLSTFLKAHPDIKVHQGDTYDSAKNIAKGLIHCSSEDWEDDSIFVTKKTIEFKTIKSVIFVKNGLFELQTDGHSLLIPGECPEDLSPKNRFNTEGKTDNKQTSIN